MSMFVRFLLLASATIVVAQPTSTRTSTPTGLAGEPCGVVASIIAEGELIPAQTALECLDSVPVDIQGNSQLIDELQTVWEFQSEHGWLKNTPKDWENGPLDITAELNTVKSNLGSYSSEYAVQLAIQNITIRTGNYHFNYVPDILQIFQFRRQISIASISDDGKSLPKVYVHDDIALLALGADKTSISEISEINGEEPYSYLKTLAAWEQYIDTDGRLNSLFSKGDTGSGGTFRIQSIYDGPTTEITWANGSTASVDNFARTQYSFDTVTDGQSFFEAFCTGLVSGTESLDTNDKMKPITPGTLGPQPRIPDHRRRKRQSLLDTEADTKPIVAAESGAVAGYYLSGSGYDEVAVLRIITFQPNDTVDATGSEFQSIVSQFLQACVKDQKTKLIIDLRENGGGATNLLLDTFMQLFPQQEPFSGQRYRVTQQFTAIGDVVNEIHNSADLSRAYASMTGELVEETYRYWAYWHFRNSQGEDFGSWDEFNGPLTFNSDQFTQTMRYNYSNNDRVSILPNSFDFVNGTNRPTPFNASNIVMFTDGLCGSSCASFHEELKNIAGIKAVTVGGRPENRPMQTITGTKGGEVVPLFLFPTYAQGMLNISQSIGVTKLSSSSSETLTTLANTTQISIRVGDRSSRAQSQDQIRKGDKTATPLQFIYEAADCKIFYTANTYIDPQRAWEYVWDVFQDNSKCVQGSTGHESSISGGFEPYGAGELKKEDLPEGESGSKKKSAASSVKASSIAAAVVVAVLITAL